MNTGIKIEQKRREGKERDEKRGERREERKGETRRGEERGRMLFFTMGKAEKVAVPEVDG